MTWLVELCRWCTLQLRFLQQQVEDERQRELMRQQINEITVRAAHDMARTVVESRRHSPVPTDPDVIDGTAREER